MEDPKKHLLAEAHAHEKRKDWKAAGDAFARAGAHEEAARVYLAGGHFVQAGQTLLRLISADGRPVGANDASKKSVLLKAAICFSRAGDVAQAVQIFLDVGERRRAVELLQSVGDVVNAAHVESDRTGRVQLVGYAAPKEVRTDQALETARRLESAGKQEAAMETYAQQKQWADAARLARALGKAERAAGYFAEAAMPFEAAECYLQCRNRDRALASLWQVTAAHPRYREACMHAIRICADRSTLSFDLEHVVTSFLATDPTSDDEVDAFYAIALLFESNQSYESAANCYRRILAKRPRYRDVEARLRATVAEDRGASAKDFERIVQEEQVFREAVRRHGTPLASPAWPPEPDIPDDLPELPELPELPSLPPLPQPPRGSQAATPTQRVAISALPMAKGGLLREGVVINDRYRLEKKIGQGGMGAVWKALDLDLDETIAIKFLATGLVDDEVLGRFKQEVSLSRQFSHPNVIRMYDLGGFGENKYITMELLDGEDLGAVLKRGPLPLGQAITLLIQASGALQVVHDHGVVHRDVKPDNFFLCKDGVLKVMDFGIAKRQSASKGLTRAGMMAGTPQYIAPEQASDFGSVSHLADIYALGCIAYKMLTGQVPFDGDEVMRILLAHVSQPPVPPRKLNPAIPEDLETIVLQLLAKQPEDRVQSCRDLAVLLSRLLPAK
jgi:tetratricopeptide (TPR) repeat protein